jgi:hypothetical protein
MFTHASTPFESPERKEYYSTHAIALSGREHLLFLASESSKTVTAYDTSTLRRRWSNGTSEETFALRTFDCQILVSIRNSPMLVLEQESGTTIRRLKHSDGWIYGIGVLDGLSDRLAFVLDCLVRISVYLAMLQHFLLRQANPLHLPLEMWDCIEKYRL